jgi:hypothetical protein
MQSRLGVAAAGVLALVLVYGAWSIQVAGLRGDLLDCREQARIAKEAADAEQKRILDEGRAAANAEGERLRAEAAERQKQLEGTIASLRGITKRLEAPQPPIIVTAMSEPPIVVSPPMASCALDRGTLDELQQFLNRGRS